MPFISTLSLSDSFCSLRPPSSGQMPGLLNKGQCKKCGPIYLGNQQNVCNLTKIKTWHLCQNDKKKVQAKTPRRTT